MNATNADRILVINPNSSETVTHCIDAAVEPLRMPGAPACMPRASARRPSFSMTPTNRVTTHPAEKILRCKFLGPLGFTVRPRVA